MSCHFLPELCRSVQDRPTSAEAGGTFGDGQDESGPPKRPSNSFWKAYGAIMPSRSREMRDEAGQGR
jgi:hypothetical protein